MGCGGNSPQPSDLSKKSSTPTATATPTASPSPTTAAKPAAFVRQYIAAANQAVGNGDVARMRAMSAPGCDFCQSTAKSLATFHADGGSYVGDANWHVTEVGKPTGTNPVKLSAYVKVNPHKVVSKRGASPEPDPGRLMLFDFTLAKGQGRWTVKNLVVN
ncbi:hypothetical protein [Actinopolymorpha rutila]|uniref:Uncharacterized protein n=1 Tax=Actinopolymorpha rutila TaxID=446787 RepID=A0A852ZDC2_9ACTN|nr:hypothetical protein [Actinopolymorpha rutila]NYH90185.1 hypothetical protein [Actinopolymorpha rutila]